MLEVQKSQLRAGGFLVEQTGVSRGEIIYNPHFSEIVLHHIWHFTFNPDSDFENLVLVKASF
jgi:hypothetical protein